MWGARVVTRDRFAIDARARVALAVALLASACDARTAPTGDAGAGDAGIVQLPRSEPCPEGWRAVADPPIVLCDPWPTAAGAELGCALDEVHLPGGPGCQRLGPECPPDGWPTDLPADRPIVFVDDDGLSIGEGTFDDPVSSIERAIVLAPDGAVIAVATGTYDEDIVAPLPGQTVWGACVAGTRITTLVPADDRALVHVRAPGSSIRNLTIDAPARPGMILEGDGLAEDIAVLGATGLGVVIQGGSPTLRRASIAGTRPTSTGAGGHGVHVASGDLSIERSSIAGSHGAGVIALGAGAVVVRDTIIRDTAPQRNAGIAGEGVYLSGSGSIELERVVVERSHEAGVFARGAGATLVARDLVVREVGARPVDGLGGRGVQIQDGAVARIERGSIDGAREVALSASVAGTRCEARDLVIRDTALGGIDTGRGAQIFDDASCDLERVAILRSAETALNVDHAMVAVRDATILDVAPDSAGERGAGLVVVGGGSLGVERAHVERARVAGILATDPGSSLLASDLSVRSTLSSSIDGFLGAGAWAQHGAEIVLSRATISDVRVAGLVAINGGTLRAAQIVVSDVRSPECATSTCPDTDGAFGALARFGGTLLVSDFVIERIGACGVVVGEHEPGSTSVDLERGVIDSAPVGACVQVGGYETERLRRDVEYRNVGLPLQATSYSLPDALEAASP